MSEKKTETLDLAAAAAVIAGTTSLPWRYGALEFGGRALVDARGYVFASIDDDGNGAFAAYASHALPACIAEVERLRALLAEVWDIAEDRKCTRRTDEPSCRCNRLREIGEQESAP